MLTCRHIATFTRHPKLVDTALGLRPSPEKSFENDVVRFILGRSSATTTHVRTQLRLTFFCFSKLTDEPRPFVHSSITPEIKWNVLKLDFEVHTDNGSDETITIRTKCIPDSIIANGC